MSEKWEYSVSDEKLEELISKYCTDFTKLEREGRYGPITGRDKEISDCILILLQKGRKNVCFLAPAGVGKTAAVVGLAQQIVAEKVPDYLKNSRVIEVDLARMASGTTSRAEFQDRFLPLCKGVAERYHNPEKERIILFLDEIHQIMPNCVGSSYAGLSDTIKPYLTAGDLLMIGATTLDEFRMYVAQDPAMDRRFQKVFLKVPNIQETYAIMKALRPGLEKHHKVTVPDELLMLIVYLTEEHMRKRNQPDKSIITADAAMAYHVMHKGINQDLVLESIYYMVARETGLNAKAMHDEKLMERVRQAVEEFESGAMANPQKPQAKKFDPSEKLKDVEMDEEFHAQQIAAEKEEIARKKQAMDAAHKREEDQIKAKLMPSQQQKPTDQPFETEPEQQIPPPDTVAGQNPNLKPQQAETIMTQQPDLQEKVPKQEDDAMAKLLGETEDEEDGNKKNYHETFEVTGRQRS
ncbi:MAG: AAA family ATPase [Alphaproteobacteria bacterium]|nr:AAA family ATPase [Alphaproteobacteria bacterium]